MPPAIHAATSGLHSNDLMSILMALFVVCVELFLIALQIAVFTIETAVRLLCAPVHVLIVLTENLLSSLDSVNHYVSGPVITTVIRSPPVVSHPQSPNTTDTALGSLRPVPYICSPDIVSSRYYVVLVGRRIGVFEDW